MTPDEKLEYEIRRPMYRVAFVCAVFVVVGIVFIYLVADYRSKLRPECTPDMKPAACGAH